MRPRKTTLCFTLLASTCLVSPRPLLATELPTGPSVVHGSVGIASPSANAMTIQQGSPSAIVNWQGFSVGAGAQVNIQQPSASSALLNRVTGSTTSTIAGQINANGQVYLVNPNGIVITPSGAVRAGGGFVASTLGISDDDFKSGRRTFSGNGASAAVVNQGLIEVGRGGYAALLGGSVDNSGTISVPLGKVGLGAGEQATLDISGDGFLQVAVPSGSSGEKALIQHSGRIRARGGRVEMQAATAREVARQAINLSGVVEARTVGGRSGAIILGGGAGGTVNVSGRLEATARPGRRQQSARPRPSGGTGGEITITGDQIRLAGATIDASGRKGGGIIRIGGDLQGTGSLPHARTAMVDGATQISADATESGNGGRIIVWSDEFTGFDGRIRAQGGPNGGDGGFAEVSSKGVLAYRGQTILTAARGQIGTLLLDPFDIFIETGTTTAGWGFTGAPPNLTFTPPLSPPPPSVSILNVVDLQNALATANVIVSTGGTGSPGAGAGNITVSAPITWSQSTTLTLNALNTITIGQAVSAPQGGLTLISQLTAGGITLAAPIDVGTLTINASGTITPTAAVNVGTFILTAGTWNQVADPLPAFSATDFRLDGGSFRRALSAGTNSYVIADIYGLQGINSFATLGFDYQLANDIDASGTRLWNGGTGFVPIGRYFSSSTLPYSGTFDGQHHTISNLYINRPGDTGTGLFYEISGSVQNLALSNVSILGGTRVGALTGRNLGAVSQVIASGTVVGDQLVGGLVGQNGSADPFIPGGIAQSRSDVSVQAGAGAVGVGGLVGQNSGVIILSYATGAVTSGAASTSVGGLIGSNLLGSVDQSYATVPVNGGAGSTSVGGLIGSNTGAVTASFWDIATSGQAQGIGTDSAAAAPTGLTTAQFQDPGIFVPLARAQGWDFETNWAPPSAGFYPELYAISPVIRVVTDNATRLYGDANPAFPVLGSFGGPGTFGFGPAGDTVDLSGALASPAGATSPVGLYPIVGVNQTSAQGVGYRVVATLADAALTPALTVAPAPLSLTANNQTATYGTPFPFTGTEFTATGLRNGETVGAATLLSAGASALANVGLYPILIGNAAGGTFNPANYSISYAAGTLAVTPASLIIAANNQLKAFGQPFSFGGFEFTATGLQNGETVGAATLSSDGAAALAGLGFYPILIGGAAGGTFNPANYTISYVPGTMIVAVGGLAGLALAENTAAGVPSRQLPVTTVDLPNPPDVMDLTGLSGGGGSVGGGGPTLGTGRPGELDAARDTLAAIERSSNDLESKVASCEGQFGRRDKEVREYTSCVSDALEQFATALDSRALTLPGPMRGIPAVIRQAARQVRAARTVQEARVAVRAALTEVRKAIALIRADDPAIGQLQLRQGNRIATALGSVETRLSRATGL
ncbi:MBG domain-containing protein [Bosea sp. BK604]|uniref:two-partner secretion domain-containing protein n=1 Tax=Bosea sp. BK604 TaxID=2512180 RepID=UPI0010E4FC0F|nr:MBG domain-containing protein [Bosea sp. BK604]TCR63424.1 filamentous hemagglutinin family protein [Bosea sp. BK604]